MFRIFAAHFRKVGRAFSECFSNIAAGIEANDQEMKQAGIRGLKWLLIPRLILWGPGVVYYTVKGGGLGAGYVELVAIFYIMAAAITAMTPAPELPQQEVVVPPSDAIAMKHAKQGRDNLLDIVLAVGESLERQITGAYTILCPASRGQLAYPHVNRCIRVQNGVASTTVAFPYTGEINAAQFLERFNDRICQMLNAGELPYRPNPVYTGKENNVPYTAIQAIHADVVGDHVILEVIRVTEEAIPLLDALDRQGGTEANDQGQLYDDEL